MNDYGGKSNMRYFFAYVGTYWQAEKKHLMSMGGVEHEVVQSRASCLTGRREIEHVVHIKQSALPMESGGGEVLKFTGQCPTLDTTIEVERVAYADGYHDIHIHSTTGGKEYDYSATRVSEQMVHLFGGHGEYRMTKDSKRPKLSLEERAMLESIPCRLTRDIIFSTITRTLLADKKTELQDFE